MRSLAWPRYDTTRVKTPQWTVLDVSRVLEQALVSESPYHPTDSQGLPELPDDETAPACRFLRLALTLNTNRSAEACLIGPHREACRTAHEMID